MDWSDIQECIDNIVNNIRELNIKVDSLVSIGRGGMVPTSMLAYSLNNTNVYHMGLSTRHTSDYSFTQPIPSNILLGNIMFIDDINDSGKTFEIVNKIYGYSTHKAERYFCSLFTRHNTSFFTNTITGKNIDSDDWVVFPWDK